MHFCVLTARVYGRFSCPRKIGLNWFIPALVNSSVGSSSGTTGELGTNVCPCRCRKKSMNCWRISRDVISAPGKVPDYSQTFEAGQGIGPDWPGRAATGQKSVPGRVSLRLFSEPAEVIM